MPTEKSAHRVSASGSVSDLETTTKSTNGRIPKVKKVATEPTAEQLRKGARLAKQAGVPQLAEKYHGLADDLEGKRLKMARAEQSAEFEKTAREHGAQGSEADFHDVLRKLARPEA